MWLNFYSSFSLPPKVDRPLTMKKDGIQTRNRKLATKAKKRRAGMHDFFKPFDSRFSAMYSSMGSSGYLANPMTQYYGQMGQMAPFNAMSMGPMSAAAAAALSVTSPAAAAAAAQQQPSNAAMSMSGVAASAGSSSMSSPSPTPTSSQSGSTGYDSYNSCSSSSVNRPSSLVDASA